MPKVYINPPALFPSLQYGFSQVVTSTEGKLVFLSGQVAWDERQQMVGPDDLRAQTWQSFRNVRTAMEAAGCDPVVLVGGAPLPGACDRSADHLAIEQLHHRLRRRPDDRDLGVADEVHVRARVDLPQDPVHVDLGAAVQQLAYRLLNIHRVSKLPINTAIG